MGHPVFRFKLTELNPVNFCHPQILSDVLAEIEESKKKLDIREEDPEVTVLRVLSMLRLLKYKPPPDISAQFREGLLEGHKLVRTKPKDYSKSLTA